MGMYNYMYRVESEDRQVGKFYHWPWVNWRVKASGKILRQILYMTCYCDLAIPT